jgi:hypothetical protein
MTVSAGYRYEHKPAEAGFRAARSATAAPVMPADVVFLYSFFPRKGLNS